MEQPQYNMFHRERVEKEYRRLYSHFGMGTTIWSPLASGILTGKYNAGIPGGARAGLHDMEWLREKFSGEDFQKKIEKVKLLDALAKELNTSLPKLSIAWCLANRNVSTVILGASKIEQLRENLESLELMGLFEESLTNRIESILSNKPSDPSFG
jgi:aryl-alcohol dehydrogenase-like predicted oxidoreductase